MDIQEYKSKMFDVVNRFAKKDRGAKYVRHWDIHLPEKEYTVKKAEEFGMLDNVKTAVDVTSFFTPSSRLSLFIFVRILHPTIGSKS